MGKNRKWVRVKANQVEPEDVMDERLDMELDDLLDEDSLIRFVTVAPRVGVNMNFSLLAVFRVCSKENKSRDNSERQVIQEDQRKES